ncbi:amidase [Tistrella mobilis]|uniref:amidase n=1 Tax=Tistrella mobilis TaxID=171437 RepID=UPI0035583E1E
MPEEIPMDELIRATARDLVARLARGEVTPNDLLDALERRVEAVDGAVNAVVTRAFDQARAAARHWMPTTDRRRQPGRLHGLPVAIKDLTATAGIRTTYGSPLFAGNVPARSDNVAARLEERGGIIYAKTNTPEFGAGAQTFNEVFGTTTNPWNTSLTPGGSSGGSAVALASGTAWLAQGSDLGGSLRIPAAFTGVVGLRPTPGRVPHGPSVSPFSTLSVEGPMARDVADLGLMLDAMAGLHPRDPLSREAEAGLFEAAATAPRKPRRVAVSVDLGIVPVAADVRAAFGRAADRLAAEGVEIVPLETSFAEAESAFKALRAGLMATLHEDMLQAHRDRLKPDLVWNIEHGLGLDAATLGRAERARAKMTLDLIDELSRVDLVLTPTVLTPPFPHTIRALEEIEGHRFETYVSWLALTFAITLTGTPAMSLPAGRMAGDLPFGLQLVGRPADEAALLTHAAWMETVFTPVREVPVDPRIPA